MATISACAVGSFVAVTRFVPSAMTRPSLTMTQPNGPPPARMFSKASAMARRMNSADMWSATCVQIACAGEKAQCDDRRAPAQWYISRILRIVTLETHIWIITRREFMSAMGIHPGEHLAEE